MGSANLRTVGQKPMSINVGKFYLALSSHCLKLVREFSKPKCLCIVIVIN